MSPRKPTENDQKDLKVKKSNSATKKRVNSRLSFRSRSHSPECEPYDLYEGEKLVNYLNDEQFSEENLPTEELSDEIKEKIQSLDIVYNWQVPILHRIGTRLSNTPNQKQRQLFEDNAIEVKPGLFNLEEDKTIKKNFADFCEEYHFNHDPAPFMLPQKVSGIHLIQRKRFVQYLAKDLPDRMLCSVYNRFNYLFKDFKNGRFTEDEDALILDYVKNCNEKADVYLVLSKKLKRHRHCIFKRFKYLISTKVDIERFMIENEDFQWDKINIKKMVFTLMEVLEVDKIEDLKNFTIPKQAWIKIAEKTNIPASRMKAFWETKLSTQFFAEKPIYLANIRREIINYFAEIKNYKYWGDISWKQVAEDFYGVQPLFLFLRMRDMVKRKVPKELQSDVKAAANYLKDIYYEKKTAKTMDRRLIRLRISTQGKIKRILDD